MSVDEYHIVMDEKTLTRCSIQWKTQALQHNAVADLGGALGAEAAPLKYINLYQPMASCLCSYVKK